MGFSLSELERNRLIEEGFSPDMISTGDKPFKFLGCQIKPSFLRDGAVCRLSELCDDMQEIANAFNDEKTTLKGRRLVCQTLLLSRLQSAIITAFELKESDMKRIKKKIIDSFVHRKRYLRGSGNTFLFQPPKYFEKYLVARTSLLKGIFTKISNQQTIPVFLRGHI